ncbi:metal ABC transporter substrate-binding protein [Oxalobacteraceae bacterium R-40]|uniref:Metal ABC transporter substrate-binding protein n=1 Tax=Keguizhuia sedimenti TaxID=3064264 RepID=A0ABU1BJ27_9BURK|nr:metal ABC transporter substrate-binding protein [Oxalobacteraceae bacterium R-40]
MRAAWKIAIALLLALGFLPGQAAAGEKLKIVATTSDLKALVVAIGGERVEVDSIAAPNQDPHSIELKPNQIARLRNAALVVRIGLDHEPWLSRLQSNAQILDVSRGVRLTQTETPRLRVERRAHVHAFGNPHYWLDPENARPMTAAIADALAKLSPSDRAYFDTNRNNFLKKLDGKLEKWKAALAPYRGTRAVVIHDSWTYFAERFGLSIVAAAEPTPGVPPSPSELAKLFARMRDGDVRLIIADPHSNPSLVEQIAQRSGARAVTLIPSVGADPAAGDYTSLFDVNVRRLVEAMR